MSRTGGLRHIARSIQTRVSALLIVMSFSTDPPESSRDGPASKATASRVFMIRRRCRSRAATELAVSRKFESVEDPSVQQ